VSAAGGTQEIGNGAYIGTVLFKLPQHNEEI